MRKHHADQFRPEQRQAFHAGPVRARLGEVVVRFPKLEQQFDLPARPLQNHDLFPRQKCGQAVGHENCPVAQVQMFWSRHAAVLLGTLVSGLSTSVRHLRRHSQGDQPTFQTLRRAQRDRHVDRRAGRAALGETPTSPTAAPPCRKRPCRVATAKSNKPLARRGIGTASGKSIPGRGASAIRGRPVHPRPRSWRRCHDRDERPVSPTDRGAAPTPPESSPPPCRCPFCRRSREIPPRIRRARSPWCCRRSRRR